MGKIPQIPDPTSVQFSQAIKQWIEVAEGVRGPAFPLDRAVKVKDLIDPDFINKLAGYEFPITKAPPDGYIGDESAPRPPTNLQVTSEVFRNILTWDDPTSDNFWYIEVFRAKVPAGDPAPTVVDAIKIASVPKTVEAFIDTEIFVTSYDYYYWIRAVSYAGVASLWQDGYIPGATTVGGMIDSIMEILKGADPAAWSSIVNYVVDDRVLHADKRYKCILANLNQEPPNTTYWERSGILITGEVGGVPTVGVDGNLIVDGTILARCINVDDAFIGATIQSTVFTPGSAGWQINKNGDVEFNSGVFRGTTVWENIDGAPAFPSDANLIGYWPLDDGTGTVAVDASGRGNDGTLVNMEEGDWVHQSPGKGLCLNFGGTNEYVNIPDTGTFDIGTSDYTACAWINGSDKTGNSRLINSDSSAVWIPLYIQQTTGLLRTGIGGTFYSPSGGSNVCDGQDHFVAVSVDRDGLASFYVDGILDGTADVSGTSTYSISVTNIYLGGPSAFWVGKIDEPRIYDIAITANEIKALYLYPVGNGVTKISGGQITCDNLSAISADLGSITAGTIQSTNWAAAAGMQIDLNTAKITIRETDGLEVDSDGGVKVMDGGDIIMHNVTGTGATNRSYIKFIVANSDTINLAADYGSKFLSIYPSTGGSAGGALGLGYDFLGGETPFRYIYVQSYASTEIESERNSTHYARCSLFSNADNSYAQFYVRAGSTLARAKLYATDAGSVSFTPWGAGVCNLGTATSYWKDVSYKTLTDRGCLGWFDGGVEMPDGSFVSDIEALNLIQKDSRKDTIYGIPMLDYRTMPKAVYKPADDNNGKLYLRDKDDEPYGFDEDGNPVYPADGAEMSALISIMLGAIKQLDSKIETINEKIN